MMEILRLHYLFLFLIAGATLVHLAALRHYALSSSLGTLSSVDKAPCYPYLYVKDLV